MLNRKPLRGSFGGAFLFPPVAAYGVNWGLLARTPTGFIWYDECCRNSFYGDRQAALCLRSHKEKARAQGACAFFVCVFWS